MDIARPPEGFRIVERPAVAALIAAEAGRWPRLPQLWTDIKARLARTGHREGVRVRGGPVGARLFITDGDRSAGLPRVKIVYVALGDTLTIHIVVID